MQNEDNVAVHSPLIERQPNRICLCLFAHPFSFFSSCSLPNVCLWFRDRLCVWGTTDIFGIYLCTTLELVHNFQLSINSTYVNPKSDPLAPEKETWFSGSARCSRQKETREGKRGLVQMFNLFMWTCSEYALPGFLFSLLQKHDVSCPKGWQRQ